MSREYFWREADGVEQDSPTDVSVGRAIDGGEIHASVPSDSHDPLLRRVFDTTSTGHLDWQVAFDMSVIRPGPHHPRDIPGVSRGRTI
jgi:hypothetical protein